MRLVVSVPSEQHSVASERHRVALERHSEESQSKKTLVDPTNQLVHKNQ